VSTAEWHSLEPWHEAKLAVDSMERTLGRTAILSNPPIKLGMWKMRAGPLSVARSTPCPDGTLAANAGKALRSDARGRLYACDTFLQRLA
jgi:hypothetical protein